MAVQNTSTQIFFLLSFTQGQTCTVIWWCSQSFQVFSLFSHIDFSPDKILARLILSWYLLFAGPRLSDFFSVYVHTCTLYTYTNIYIFMYLIKKTFESKLRSTWYFTPKFLNFHLKYVFECFIDKNYKCIIHLGRQGIYSKCHFSTSHPLSNFI